MEKPFLVRQGDVIIKPSKIIEGEKQKNLVLAEGERTGHAHRLTRGQAEVYKTMVGLMFLKVLSEGVLFHEEHEDIKLPVGNYQILIQREFDWFSEEVRNVQD